jgi:hypothetical protein
VSALTLVALRDRMIWIAGRLRTADDVAPPSTDLGSGRDGNDGVVLELDARVAGKVAVVDILKWIVAGRGANALQLALILAIHRHLLEDGVTAGRSHEGEDGG